MKVMIQFNSYFSTLLLLTLCFTHSLQAETNNKTKASTKTPNILFCIADDASFPHMGAYGCRWVKTPHFDRIAKQGLLFNRAYTPNAKCAPSRACILTGRNSWQLKEAANHWCYFPREFKTYAEALTEHGYHVGKTAKGWAPGIALDKNGKKRLMTGIPFDKRRAKPPTKGISNIDYAANFEDFLNATPKEKPFCFWYGCSEPHRKYEYGSGVSKGGKKTADIDSVPQFFPDNKIVRNDMLDYALEIEHFDKHLGRMLKLLEERGELENTIIVVTADNGMPFPRIKGQEYELSNHLPLAIMWKKGIRNPGRVINDYVNFIDFAPTFLEVAGLKWSESGMKPSSGKSLTDIFNSTKSGTVNPTRDHILIGKERHDIGRPHDGGYPIRGIVKEEMLYLRNFETDRWPQGDPITGYLNCDGGATKTEVLQSRRKFSKRFYWKLCFGKRPAEELYNLKTDPECMVNLAKIKKHQTLKMALQKEMTHRLTLQKDPRILGNGAIFDRYPYADVNRKNFYERYMRGEKMKTGWVNPTDFEKTSLEK